jgi:hypothetical protein
MCDTYWLHWSGCVHYTCWYRYIRAIFDVYNNVSLWASHNASLLTLYTCMQSIFHHCIRTTHTRHIIHIAIHIELNGICSFNLTCMWICDQVRIWTWENLNQNPLLQASNINIVVCSISFIRFTNATQ